MEPVEVIYGTGILEHGTGLINNVVITRFLNCYLKKVEIGYVYLFYK